MAQILETVIFLYALLLGNLAKNFTKISEQHYSQFSFLFL